MFDLRLNAWQDVAGTDVIADFAAGEDRLELRLELDGGDLLTGADLLALLDRSGDGRLDATDAGAAGGWSVSVADVTLRGATASSLLLEAGPGSGVSDGGYALCLFGVTELAGADLA